MTIKARLNRLELKIGKPRCECEQKRFEVVYVDDQPEPPSNFCPKCGQPFRRIVVKYLDRELWESI